MKNRFFWALFFSLICTVVFAQTFKRATNLPAMYINTFDKTDIDSKYVEEYAKIGYVTEGDSIIQYDSVLVRGRGNSTWNMRKKPYRIKFHEKEKFLGKGYANTKKWTVLANAGDKTLIRNAVTSAMGEFLGLKFNPAHKFVDLYINNAYNGNYQISDQIDVRPHRVNIQEQDYPLADTSDITGGYLLEVDGFQDGNSFISGHSVKIRVHYPDEDEIANKQNQYIRNFINDFENHLFSKDFTDKELGYRSMVDSLSLVRWYIATEVSANIDGFYSTYFYKKPQDQRIFFGPLWDYDIAYGNDTRKGDTSQTLMTDNGYGDTKFWINQMWQDPWFGDLVNRHYNKALDDGLVDFMMETIDSLTTLLDASQKRNYQKWGISTRMYNERVLYSSYDKYVNDLKDFIVKHCDYLRDAFANKAPAMPTPDFEPLNRWYRITNSGNGKALDLVGQSEKSGTQVCIWSNLEDRISEEWQIKESSSNGSFLIINRHSGMALNDPTEGKCTPTTNIGTQLDVVTPNEKDSRQHWVLMPQGTEGYYNLINEYTGHTANLSGGGSADGTNVLSYTTDSRNSESKNRLWYIIPGDEILDETDIRDVEPEEYALAYDPHSQVLHFGSETPDMLNFMVNVYSINGMRVGRFRADEEFSMRHLSRGTYVISWTVGGKTRTTKLQK